MYSDLMHETANSVLLLLLPSQGSTDYLKKRNS